MTHQFYQTLRRDYDTVNLAAKFHQNLAIGSGDNDVIATFKMAACLVDETNAVQYFGVIEIENRNREISDVNSCANVVVSSVNTVMLTTKFQELMIYCMLNMLRKMYVIP